MYLNPENDMAEEDILKGLTLTWDVFKSNIHRIF